MSPMKWSSLILVAFALTALQASAVSVWNGEKVIQKCYAKIDQYLTKKSNNATDMDGNMELIHECVRKSFHNPLKYKDPMMEAQETLDKLRDLTKSEWHCFDSGYNIISDNLRLSKGLPRLRQVVKHFVAKSAEYCEPIFGSLSQEGLPDGVDEESRASWLNLTGKIAEQLTGLQYEQYLESIEDVLDESQNASKNLYEFIQTKIKNPSKQVDVGQAIIDTMTQMNVSEYSGYLERYKTQRVIAQWDEFTWSILKYIVEPCAGFVSKMNRNRRFQMASAHSRVLNRNYKFVKNPHSRGASFMDLASFYKDWVRYEICRGFVVKDKKEIYKTIKDMRAKVLDYTPGENHPDCHLEHPITIEFPSAQVEHEADLFDANE